MARTNVRITGRPLRGKPVGEVVSLSRRDARVLEAIGRVEFVEPQAPEPEKKRRTPVKKAKPRKAPPRKAVLETPEAPLQTVAHTDPPARGRSRKAK